MVPKPEPAVSDKETFSLKVNLNVGQSVKTKALQEAAVDYIRDIQIFVFDESRHDSIETYIWKRTTADHSAASDSLRVTAGKKKIRVLANAPICGNIVDRLEHLDRLTSQFDMNTPEKFVMSGGTEMELTSDSSVDVTVNRLVAKIVLKKVSVCFDGCLYNMVPFTLNDLYLTNVTFRTKYYGGEYIPGPNQQAQTWENGLKYDLTKEVGINAGLGQDDEPSYWDEEACEIVYNVEHIFYCYPNSNEDHPTRLVLKTVLDESTYYYPINLGTIESNKVYTITDLRITRPGSKDPDIPVVSQMFPYNITVGDWDEEVNEIQEII